MVQYHMPSQNKKSFNFEDSLRALDKLVTEMERGDLDLNKSLECFEQGVAIIRQCQEALQATEQKIQEITEKMARD